MSPLNVKIIFVLIPRGRLHFRVHIFMAVDPKL
jgi:hypothetical protein